MSHRWDHHPAVTSGSDLSFGDRCADRMKSVFATWPALIGILGFMGIWIWTGGFGVDAKPYILLNLMLSCIAALQCFILLIAAKRQDQIASELARSDYEADVRSRDLLEALTAQHADLAKSQEAQTATLGRLLASLPVAPDSACECCYGRGSCQWKNGAS